MVVRTMNEDVGVDLERFIYTLSVPYPLAARGVAALRRPGGRTPNRALKPEPSPFPLAATAASCRKPGFVHQSGCAGWCPVSRRLVIWKRLVGSTRSADWLLPVATTQPVRVTQLSVRRTSASIRRSSQQGRRPTQEQLFHRLSSRDTTRQRSIWPELLMGGSRSCRDHRPHLSAIPGL